LINLGQRDEPSLDKDVDRHVRRVTYLEVDRVFHQAAYASASGEINTL
jgi:hypothetical protein